MEILDGQIIDYNESGDVTIRTRYENVDRFVSCGYKEAAVMLRDSRTITADQRKKIYAMLAEIADYMGEFPDIVKKQFKWELR